MEFLIEFYQFLKIRNKLWMYPVVIVCVFLAGVFILAENTLVAPFIYTLF